MLFQNRRTLSWTPHIVPETLICVVRNRLNKLQRLLLPSARKSGEMNTDGHPLNRLVNPLQRGPLRPYKTITIKSCRLRDWGIHGFILENKI